MTTVVLIQENDANQFVQNLAIEIRQELRDQIKLLKIVGNTAELDNLGFTPGAIVAYWPTIKYPHLMIEKICQSPALCSAPLVILYDHLEASDTAFCREYKLKNNIGVKGMPKRTIAHRIMQLIDRVSSGDGKANLENHIRQFYALVHADAFEQAADYLDAHLKKNCSEDDLAFYQATILKSMKRFDDAIAKLSKYLRLSISQLDIRFVHLIGNIEFKRKNYPNALQFLSAANKMSPRNLRRRFTLAQCLFEMGDKKQALGHYLRIYKSCPLYPGIHTNIIELKFHDYSTAREIERLNKLIHYLTTRQLIGLYKRIQKNAAAEKVRVLNDMIIREMSKRANTLIDEIDFYGALKIYFHIQKIVDPSDSRRNKNLNYCVARAYYRAGDLEFAYEYIQKAAFINSGIDPLDEKIKNMQILIVTDMASKLPTKDTA